MKSDNEPTEKGDKTGAKNPAQGRAPVTSGHPASTPAAREEKVTQGAAASKPATKAEVSVWPVPHQPAPAQSSSEQETIAAPPMERPIKDQPPLQATDFKPGAPPSPAESKVQAPISSPNEPASSGKSVGPARSPSTSPPELLAPTIDPSDSTAFTRAPTLTPNEVGPTVTSEQGATTPTVVEQGVDPVAHEVQIDAGTSAGFLLAGASKRGRSHVAEGKYREDAVSMVSVPAHGGWLIAVADGAGSAGLSRVGANAAAAAVATFARPLIEAGEDPVSILDRSASAALRALLAAAKARKAHPDELACTLLLLLWQETPTGGKAYTFQVGDGLIAVYDSKRELQTIGVEEDGGFAGETVFLTSRPALRGWSGCSGPSHSGNAPWLSSWLRTASETTSCPYARTAPSCSRTSRRFSRLPCPPPHCWIC